MALTRSADAAKKGFFYSLNAGVKRRRYAVRLDDWLAGRRDWHFALDDHGLICGREELLFLVVLVEYLVAIPAA